MDISVVTLSALITLEALTLRTILRETRALQELYGVEPEHAPRKGSLGMRMPSFSLQEIDSGHLVTDRDMRGQHVMLLFVARSNVLALGVDTFAAVVQGLFTQAGERLYLICEGDTDDARWIRDRSDFSARYGGRLTLLIAPDAHLRKQLRATSMPNCVVFDEKGIVRKIGHPVTEQRAPAPNPPEKSPE
ncbi:hypothetical protein [Steroidobacter agaridevorans]|nr:hypothetical protein [Steroidobacter agaridevorans]